MGRYVALMRAIAHTPMAPFRAALEELGFTDVTSFGMSGNLIFTAPPTRAATLEDQIGAKLGAVIIIRSAKQIAATARADPFAGHAEAAVLFLKRPPPAEKRAAFLALDVPEPRPVLRRNDLHIAGWVTVAGKRIDLEKKLGAGTMRSSGIVARLAEIAAE
ncbi:MAG: DUF1697 domain-containing protein [Bauldia sp.]|nr:DUF1697 domain-containing protein [Bauldia sp.]